MVPAFLLALVASSGLQGCSNSSPEIPPTAALTAAGSASSSGDSPPVSDASGFPTVDSTIKLKAKGYDTPEWIQARNDWVPPIPRGVIDDVEHLPPDPTSPWTQWTFELHGLDGGPLDACDAVAEWAQAMDFTPAYDASFELATDSTDLNDMYIQPAQYGDFATLCQIAGNTQDLPDRPNRQGTRYASVRSIGQFPLGQGVMPGAISVLFMDGTSGNGTSVQVDATLDPGVVASYPEMTQRDQ